MNAVVIDDFADDEPGVGTRLALARADHDLSVEDVAHQLKLSVWQIQALEDDRYQQLPRSPVFVRGFIRNYARLVGLDPAPLLAEVDLYLPHSTHATSELPPSADIPFPTGRPVKWYRYVLLVLVLAVPAIAFELYQEDSTEILVKPHLAAPLAQSLEAGVPAATAPTIVNPPPPSSFAAHLSDSVTAADASEAEPGAYHLTFVFDRESWVEVRDGHGRRLLWQLNPAGSRQTVVGVPPLSLVIGNAPGVHLTLNQQPVDLAPHTDIDVARLTLE